MKLKRINLLAFVFAFLMAQSFSRLPIAQGAATASVAAYAIENSGADDSTARVVSDLLFSFIRETREYSLDFIGTTRAEAEAAGSAAAQDASHDFAFFAKLSARDGGITLELFLKNNGSAASRAITRNYENQNKLMLNTRLLVRELFDWGLAPSEQSIPRVSLSGALEPYPSLLDDNAAAASGAQNERSAFDASTLHLNDVASVDALVGSWNGELGIEKIMILRGGRGAAVFSSGFSLMLSLSVEGGELIVVQRGRSSPLQFVDLPDPVAEKAAAQAPPIEWRLRVSDDGNILAGLKNTVQVTHDGQNILSITEKREQVAWTRN